MKAVTVALLLFCTSLLVAQQESVISGKLLGYDKKPMPLAHAHILKAPNPQPIQQVQAAPDGSFEIRTKETGVVLIEFTGVNHSALDLPLIIEKPLKLALTVCLSTYAYADDIKDVKLMSDLTNFSFNQAQPMLKQSDGTFAIELQTSNPKLAYQVFGADKNSRSINGTQSDSYEFDGAGDYKSIVSPKNGKIRITFDPKKVVRSDSEPVVTFKDPNNPIAKVALIQMEMTKRASTWGIKVQALAASGGKDFKYNWSSAQQEIVKQLRTEKDPLVRQALLLNYVDTKARNAMESDPKIGVQALKEIPPDSKLWMMPTLQLMKVAGDLAGDQSLFENYLSRFLEKNPDETLKTNLLMNLLMMAKMQGDEKGLKSYYDLTMKSMGDTPFGKMVKEKFSPTIAIAVGRTVPAFAVKEFEDPTKILTNETFKGKVYLLDFWATWCGPCVAEMENLHKAYEKFKSKNFEILSLSLDQKPEDVTKFRKDKWKMPWLHTFVTNDKEVQNAFDVIAIPRPVLVDTNGKIVALDADLRGEQLEATLAKYLK
jgi:thiol-disulfide isomerase/thioredoxin